MIDYRCPNCGCVLHVPGQEWIPVSERLPEEKTEVLVTSSEYLYIAEYEVLSDGTRYWSEVIEYRYIQDVTAWMPLPEPFKGGDQE